MNDFLLAQYFLSLLICFTSFVDSLSDHPLVLLISLDGLNHKFVTQSNTPNIWNLGQNGVIASKGIKVQLTTVTASNHHCIVTGLYQESHGIIDNTFYDPEFKEWFDIWNFQGNIETYKRSLMSHWYMGGEPIWQTNMQIGENRLSGTYQWPMGDADIPTKKSPHKSKTWTNYTNYDEWKKEIDELLQWYTNETDPINLGLYYNAQPDHCEHDNDLYGENVTEIIHELDKLIGYLVQRCKDLNIFDKLNLILTADHGHTTVKDEAHTFTLEEYLSKNLVLNSSCSYFPRKDLGVSADDIYKNLSRAMADGLPLRVWRKSEFPDRYHWKNNRRVGPVIMFYNFGYQTSKTHPYPHGTHGYMNDYEDMNAFFVAHGPAFKKGFTIDTDYVQNIDIYPLMCHILGVQPSPNNGSFERIAVILDSSPIRDKFYNDSFIVWFIIFSVVVPCFALFLYFVALCMSRRRSASSASNKRYSKLQTNSNFVDSNFEIAAGGGGFNLKGNSAKTNPGFSSNGMRVGNKPLLQLEKDGTTDDEL